MNRLNHQNEFVNNKKRSNSLLIIVYILLCLFLGTSFYKNIKLLVSSQKDLKSARMLLDAESDTFVNNQRKIDEINNATYAEKIARDTLGLGRANELVLTFPEGNDLKKLSPRLFQKSDKELLPKPENWEAWLKLLF